MRRSIKDSFLLALCFVAAAFWLVVTSKSYMHDLSTNSVGATPFEQSVSSHGAVGTASPVKNDEDEALLYSKPGTVSSDTVYDENEAPPHSKPGTVSSSTSELGSEDRDRATADHDDNVDGDHRDGTAFGDSILAWILEHPFSLVIAFVCAVGRGYSSLNTFCDRLGQANSIRDSICEQCCAPCARIGDVCNWLVRECWPEFSGGLGELGDTCKTRCKSLGDTCKTRCKSLGDNLNSCCTCCCDIFTSVTGSLSRLPSNLNFRLPDWTRGAYQEVPPDNPYLVVDAESLGPLLYN